MILPASSNVKSNEHMACFKYSLKHGKHRAIISGKLTSLKENEYEIENQKVKMHPNQS